MPNIMVIDLPSKERLKLRTTIVKSCCGKWLFLLSGVAGHYFSDEA